MTTRRLTIFVSHPSHFLTDSWPHGDGLIAYSLLRRLADRGHTLHVAVPLSGLTKPMSQNVRLYPLKTTVPHTKDHQSLPYRVEYAFRVRSLFSQLSKGIKFDLIHQMNPVVGGLSLFLYGLGYPLLMGPIWPLWTSLGEKAAGRLKLSARMKDVLLTPQFFRSDGILTPTPASAARLPRSIRSSYKCFPFHLGIDLDEFSPDPAATPGNPTVLFLANMQERKGIFVLLSAFAQVAERCPSARLIVAGDGAHLDEVRRRIQESAHRDRIQVLGHVSRDEVASTLRACSVYCLPSFGEPYGMSALEAMACGKPLVVTDAGGLGHLVPGQGSIKVRPGDAPALTDALVRLLGDQEMQNDMGRFNRSYVNAFHSWNHVIEELEDIYFELLQRSSKEDPHMVESRKEELAL
jgi:glycosyltransferase involved in cell wall biosynthesis